MNDYPAIAIFWNWFGTQQETFFKRFEEAAAKQDYEALKEILQTIHSQIRSVSTAIDLKRK